MGTDFGMLRLLLLPLVLVSVSHVCAERDPIRLTHGPMLGHVTADSVRVWARTSDPGAFTVRYGTQSDELKSEVQGATQLSSDNTGSVTLAGLAADTRYHYQVWVNERPHGHRASFQTLPSAEESRHAEHNPRGLFNFRFEVGSCANQNPLHGVGHQLPTYEHLNRDWSDKVHFHIMNGDWLYEELREYPAEAWRLVQGAASVPSTVSVMRRSWVCGRTTSCTSIVARL